MVSVRPTNGAAPGGGSRHLTWLLIAAIFAFCIAPSFISYKPYVFHWDDTDYLRQSIEVSRAFWSGHAHGLAHLREITMATYSIRPPAMTLLGLPWGALNSWHDAGKCFVTLAALIAFTASVCLFLLVRIGVRPLALLFASICAFLAFAPLPATAETHGSAASFMADSLFSWIVLAALLFIPLESRSFTCSVPQAFLRGLLWGVILSAGCLTKISFLYFVALILPSVLFLKWRRGGLRAVLAASAGFLLTAAPAILYLARHGRSSVANGTASSFGEVAGLYSRSIFSFLSENLRQSPGLAVSLVLLLAGLIFLISRGRSFLRNPDLLPFLFAVGFGFIALASVNRQLRYLFPAILAAPFLLAVLFSQEETPLPRRLAGFVSILVFGGLTAAAIPMQYRADRRQTLSRPDAVLKFAAQCHADQVLLATDSPNLNGTLLDLARDLEPPPASASTDTLGYNAMYHLPIDRDFREILASDAVVFQDDAALTPPFTNLRVPDYRRFLQQHPEYVPVRVGDDVVVRVKNCTR